MRRGAVSALVPRGAAGLIRAPMQRALVHLLCGWIFLLGGAARAADVVGRVEVGEISATAATVRWRTDVPTGSRVDYGLAADRLGQKAEGGVVTDNHAVTLTGLAPGTRYFFAVGTARRQLAQGDFTTAGGGAAAPPKVAAPAAPAKPAPQPAMAPPARRTWGSPATLADHFQRHGADVGARDAEDYARKAWEFRQRAKAGELLVKVDEEGVQRVFDPRSGLFAAYNRDGTTKTFFKPESRTYFERQPGRPAKTVTP